jgi:hypothetical protein
MPCYEGRDEIERKYQDAKAARVEVVFVAVVTAFGVERVIENVDLTECGVGKFWIREWWAQHQRKDEIRNRIAEANAMHVLHRMIEREEDIEASAAALESLVPEGCESFAPPCPTAAYRPPTSEMYRVVRAFDPIEGRMLMRANLYYREAPK